MNSALKVMVVDDDTLALEVVAAALESIGHDVIKRSTALGTVLAIRRERPEVVVLDVNMPGLTGDALAKLLASSKETQPPLVVLYSASAPRVLEELVSSCGAGPRA